MGTSTGDIKLCAGCKKEFIGNRTICEACRKRKQRQGAPPESQESKSPEKNTKVELTETDKDFLRHGQEIGWENYNFKEDMFTRQCFTCNKKFTTHLQFLKFCSRACQEALLDKFNPAKR